MKIDLPENGPLASFFLCELGNSRAGAQVVKIRKLLVRLSLASCHSTVGLRFAKERYHPSMDSNDLITVDPEILGGAPVFKGTRVPLKTLFEYFVNDYTLEEFLACFPSVTHDMVRRVLERSEAGLAPPS
jgi:uncharacterized protein (DUF433 family)